MYQVCAVQRERTSFLKMPFLKPIKISLNKIKTDNSRRNGWRRSIYDPKLKYVFEGHYIGEWRNDRKNNKGMKIDRYGWMYEGDWLNGKKHGYGILSKISDNGSIRKCYVGDWRDGKKNGFGCIWYENGSYYEGRFHSNRRYGYGCIWYKNGGYYQGTWKNDVFHGEGILVQENGNKYEGRFVNGKKYGRGMFYHSNSGQLQKGYWKDDFCLSSAMEDIDLRQSALCPTQYPIPKSDLITSIDVFHPIHEICDYVTSEIQRDRTVGICAALKSCACISLE